MNKVNWTTVVLTAIIALIVLIFGANLLGRWGFGGWGYGGWGMMGPWMMGGMFFMWLIPLGFFVLVISGIVWLTRTIGGGNNPPTHAHVCPSCGSGTQAGWKNCPHCGAALAQ